MVTGALDRADSRSVEEPRRKYFVINLKLTVPTQADKTTCITTQGFYYCFAKTVWILAALVARLIRRGSILSVHFCYQEYLLFLAYILKIRNPHHPRKS